MWTSFNNVFTNTFSDELQKKIGIKSFTSPKTCCCSTLPNLNVELCKFTPRSNANVMPNRLFTVSVYQRF